LGLAFVNKATVENLQSRRPSVSIESPVGDIVHCDASTRRFRDSCALRQPGVVSHL
jgi:hypothetical protein